MNLLEERTIALAGVLQAAEQVQKLARTGRVDQAAMDTSVRSIMILDAASTPAVFGGLSGVKGGLSLLANGVLASPQANDIEQLRYTMALLTLEQKLRSQPDVFAAFGTDVESLSAVSANEMVNSCSGVYQKHISPLQPQIIVQGEEDYLERPEVPEQIRSLLLAGIRASVLWQQKGGGRFKLLWERTRMRNAAIELLQS